MQCDYRALVEESIKLNKSFNQLNKIMDEMVSIHKTVTSSANWSSLTRDNYHNSYLELKRNFDCVSSQFLNVKRYLDSVAENYSSLDQDMIRAFSKFGA